MKLKHFLNEASIKDVYKGEHTIPLKDIWSVGSNPKGSGLLVTTKTDNFVFKKEDQKFIKWYMDRVDILMKHHKKGAK